MGLGPTELIIIAVIILALFGYKKLPDAARAIGRSARILKAETKGLRDEPAPRDLESRAEAEYRRETTPPPAAAPAPPPAAPAPQAQTSPVPPAQSASTPPPAETR